VIPKLPLFLSAFSGSSYAHALTDVSGVNWSGIPRSKHAARRATRKVLPQEIAKLGCDVDNALSARRFSLLFDPLDDATPNANHAVGKIKIIDVQSSGFTNAYAGGRQHREQGPMISLDHVGWEARKTPAAGYVFFLDFPLYRTFRELASTVKISQM
jgi:hypothetical protein